MTDRHGNPIYKGDVVRVFVNVETQPNHIEYYYIGRILEAKTFRTGYIKGGMIMVTQPNSSKLDRITDMSKRVEKLPMTEAMLWQLENE